MSDKDRSRPKRLAACLYVRDEAHDIAEWLAYHHVAGVDHVLVFDNNSADATRAVVRHAARHASISLIPWPVVDRRSQMAAYAIGLWLLRDFEWVAFIDADEFLVPMHASDLKTVLERFAHADAIAVNWAVFGSAGHVDTPGGALIESFTRRADDAFEPNRLVKSIVRPRRARVIGAHRFRVPGLYVRPGGTTFAWDGFDRIADDPCYAHLKIAHYFTRSHAHWRRKVERGYRDFTRPASDFGVYDRNEQEDLSVARFLPQVRAELKRREQA